MLSYLHVKKRLLTLIFICVHNGQVDDAETWQQAVLNELSTGVDEGQLSFIEMQSIPHEYVRQACFLPNDDREGGELDEEEMARVSRELLKEYKAMQNRRYQLRNEINAIALQAYLEG